MLHKTVHSQSYVTCFRHSAVLVRKLPSITAKASQHIFWLKRAGIDCVSLIQFYFACIHSVLEYASPCKVGPTGVLNLCDLPHESPMLNELSHWSLDRCKKKTQEQYLVTKGDFQRLLISKKLHNITTL